MTKTTAAALFALVLGGCSAPGKDGLVLKPTPGEIQAAAPATNALCPVSGDSVGSMGEGRVVIWQGRAVRLCCPACVKAFADDPAKFARLARED